MDSTEDEYVLKRAKVDNSHPSSQPTSATTSSSISIPITSSKYAVSPSAAAAIFYIIYQKTQDDSINTGRC